MITSQATSARCFLFSFIPCRRFQIFPILLFLFFSASVDCEENSASNDSDRILRTTDFYQLVTTNDDFFVDKTSMIKEYLKSAGKIFLVTRPRGWGKSINTNMVKRFLEIELDENGNRLAEGCRVNDKLFAGGNRSNYIGQTKLLKPLEISKCDDSMKHLGKYPVICLNFRDITDRGGDYQQIEQNARNFVINLFRQYDYLRANLDPYYVKDFNSYASGDIDKDMLEGSLLFLSKMLERHFNQTVHILIDDYDHPINDLTIRLIGQFKRDGIDSTTVLSKILNKVFRSDQFRKTLTFIRNILGNCLRDNYALGKSLISGTLPIFVKDSSKLTLTDIMECTLSDGRFSNYYGFSQPEVDELSNKMSLKIIDRESIAYWYGYNFGGLVTYNPSWIIRHFLRSNEVEHLRTNDDDIIIINTPLVEYIMLSDQVQGNLQRLVDGECIVDESNIKVPFDVTYRGLFSLLFSNGYLNSADGIWEFQIPNEVVRRVCKAAILKWVCFRSGTTRQDLVLMARQLTEFQVEHFKRKLQERIAIASSTNNNDENGARLEVFHRGLMRSLVYCLGANDDYIITEADIKSRQLVDKEISVISLVSRPENEAGNDTILVEYMITNDWKELESRSKVEEVFLDEYANNTLRQYGYIKRVLKISMVFFGENLSLQYRIDNIDL